MGHRHIQSRLARPLGRHRWCHHRRGRVRSVSTGFAVFGLVYLLFNLEPQRGANSFGFGPQPRVTLLFEKGFVLLQPHLKPMLFSDTQGFIHYDQVGQSLGMILSGLLGAVFSQMVAAKHDRRQPSVEETDERSRKGTA